MPISEGDITEEGFLGTIAGHIATNGTAKPSTSALVAGSDGTSILPLLTDNQGRLVTSAITGYNANFSFGDVSTAALTQVVVRRTAYTEQTTNAQRSIASASANDTSAGTGARTLMITYFDSTGAGPFTETLTLNGTTGVNTVATNICFIEKITIVTVGSGLVNAGIITLYVAINKGGGVIGTIAALDNQTFWCHHYVATGKTCNVTGISNNHNGTTVGSGGVFILKAKSIGVSNVPELQVSDFIRLYGQDSVNTRNYGSPLKIIGPARLFTYITPETTSATIYRAAFDFFEP